MNILQDEHIDPASAVLLAQAVSDIALTLDGDGVVLDVMAHDPELAGLLASGWRGRPWRDTAAPDGREQIDRMLLGARHGAEPIWAQINHPVQHRGFDWPIRYCAVRLHGADRYLALGIDLHPMADLQQRLIDARERTEQDHQRLRQAESRFQTLFRATSDVVMVADAETLRITDMNPAAEALLGVNDASGNRRLLSHFAADQTDVVRSLLAQARSRGHAEVAGVRLMGSDRRWHLSTSTLRRSNAAVFMLRLAPELDQPVADEDSSTRRILGLVEAVPDAIAITSDDGGILSVNRAFAELAELTSSDQARGTQLSDWLGRSTVDARILLANIRKYGQVRRFSTCLNTAQRVATDVEVSGVSLPDGQAPCCGFVIRSSSARQPAVDSRSGMAGSRSVEQITDLVGSVPLKALVRESAELIERLGIERALTLTGDNRAAAAEMLGLSRQSLYVKLRRYGLGLKHSNAEA